MTVLSKPNTFRCRPREQGAALVVGLILLLVLTLLAVTGMNTASTELVMAGNEQYRQNAFQSAETGVENALAVLRTVPQTGGAVTSADTPVEGSTNPQDQYRTTSTYEGEDTSVAGFSAGKFTAFHYQIDSQGMSSRNATANHSQGAYVIQNSAGSGTFGPLP